MSRSLSEKFLLQALHTESVDPCGCFAIGCSTVVPGFIFILIIFGSYYSCMFAFQLCCSLVQMLGCNFYFQYKGCLSIPSTYDTEGSFYWLQCCFFFYRCPTEQTLKSPGSDPHPFMDAQIEMAATQEHNRELKRDCGGIWGEDRMTYVVISTRKSNGSIRWDHVHYCLCIAWFFFIRPSSST
jgi:hypothetical protein